MTFAAVVPEALAMHPGWLLDHLHTLEAGKAFEWWLNLKEVGAKLGMCMHVCLTCIAVENGSNELDVILALSWLRFPITSFTPPPLKRSGLRR